MSPAARKDIWPPSLTYPYFAKAAANPFRHAARRFDRVNAAWLMDLSLLVYTHDEGFVRGQLGKVGLDRGAVFVGFAGDASGFVVGVTHPGRREARQPCVDVGP